MAIIKQASKQTSDDPVTWRSTARLRRSRWLVVRPAIDAAVSLVIFTILTLTLNCAPTAANPHNLGPAAQFRTMVAPAVGDPAEERTIVEIATTSSPESPDAVYRRTSFSAALVLLSFAFSILVAFNLAFLRHMRRAYAKGSSTHRQSPDRNSHTGI